MVRPWLISALCTPLVRVVWFREREKDDPDNASSRDAFFAKTQT